MKREFLKNFQVNGVPLPDAVVDAILAEHAHDLEAAAADPGENGDGGRRFTQEEVNRIVSDRLAREREKLAQQTPDDGREQALRAREARLDCREYLSDRGYPAALLDVLDCTDAERFKTAVEAMAEKLPGAVRHAPPPYSAAAGAVSAAPDPIADAFRPRT